MKNTKQGFTLIEITIVVVIIGLLVASVIAGTSLLHSFQIRSLISDITRYKDAIARFEQVYGGLPGDLAWEAAPFTSNGGTLAAGNGDGVVTWSTGSSAESYQAWLHLASSELIKGSFSGTSTSDAAVIGTNVPDSKVDGAGFTFYNLDLVAGGGNDASDFYATVPTPLPTTLSGNYIAFGAAETSSYTSGGAISRTDAGQLDTKMDDGTPNTGSVLGTPQSESRCITVTSALTNIMVYTTTSVDTVDCNLYFRF